MRKEVKKAKVNLETAISIMKSVSTQSTIPDPVKKRSAAVVKTLESQLKEMDSIVNTFIA